tara:strand:+ start:28 stop:942 length:915 start_codon:yes stop_codon:yes gene_type:complete
MAINFYSDIHLAANKIGRDADNLLDFSTDNEITFRVSAGDGVVFKASGEIEATKFDGALEGNADTATALETARTIGGVSFNGTGNITLPGVNAEGNQNTTGNATTATGATKIIVNDNESTAEENQITFIAGAAGGSVSTHRDLEADGDLTYNPSTGTLTATLFNGKNKFAPTGSNTAGTVSGGDVVYFGGEEHTIAAGQLVHYNSSSNWELADADAASTSDGLLGVALGGDASVDGVLLRGMVTIDHDPGAIGDVLYLSTTAGDCSATAPSGSGDIVRIIGYQVNHASNGEIWFNPSADFILLA